jgi:hypothetical protein
VLTEGCDLSIPRGDIVTEAAEQQHVITLALLEVVELDAVDVCVWHAGSLVP